MFGFFYFGIFFLFSIIALLFFNKSLFWYQLVLNFYTLAFFNISYMVGLDGVAVFMVILCVFLLTLCFLFYWNLCYKMRFYIFLLFISL